jgi:hypothetical protein
MKRLSHWLRLKGTTFSLARREAVALENQSARPSRTGMQRNSSKFKKATAAVDTAADASNDTKLTSVEPLHEGGGDISSSGIYVVEREERGAGRGRIKRAEARGQKKARKPMNPLLENVTLVVYGWQNVEPGTLSWVFPSVGAAVAAARAMKNAVKWAIVAGRREAVAEDDAAAKEALDEMRAHGAVLIEEAG